MGFKKELDKIEHDYQLRLWQTYKFTEETFEQLSGNLQTPEQFSRLPKDQREVVWCELRELKETPHSELSPLARELYSAALNNYLLRTRLANLPEMALIYIVTLMEAFTKEYLLCLYVHRPELLKCSKSLTYEQILSYDNIEEIYYVMAGREVDQVSYKSIDELADYFRSKFNLDVTVELDKWNICREASYRRNLVVHNRGIVNDVYIAKVEETPELGTRLEVSIEYLCEVTNAIKDYVFLIDRFLVSKLNIE